MQMQAAAEKQRQQQMASQQMASQHRPSEITPRPSEIAPRPQSDEASRDHRAAVNVNSDEASRDHRAAVAGWTSFFQGQQQRLPVCRHGEATRKQTVNLTQS